MALNTLSIDNHLNVNGLNAPAKRYRAAEWITNKTKYMLSLKGPSQIKRHTQTESKGMEKIFHANGKEKNKAGVTVLISDTLKSRLK